MRFTFRMTLEPIDQGQRDAKADLDKLYTIFAALTDFLRVFGWRIVATEYEGHS